MGFDPRNLEDFRPEMHRNTNSHEKVFYKVILSHLPPKCSTLPHLHASYIGEKEEKIVPRHLFLSVVSVSGQALKEQTAIIDL